MGKFSQKLKQAKLTVLNFPKFFLRVRRDYFSKSLKECLGVPAMVQWLKNPTAAARVAAEPWVQSPAQHSRLKNLGLGQLRQKSQLWPESDHRPRNSMCLRVAKGRKERGEEGREGEGGEGRKGRKEREDRVLDLDRLHKNPSSATD